MLAFLRQHGFVRKGNAFIRELEQVTHVIDTQSSTSTTRDRLNLTINTGVFSKRIGSLQQKPVHGISTPYCRWTKRIGEYLPQHDDKWWVVESEDAAHIVSSEIIDHLSSFVLPELNRLTHTNDLRDLWESGRSPGLTSGQRDKLQGLIQDL